MIHKHQINGLQEFSKIDYVVAGFLFNFRDEVNGSEKLYFQDIWDFYDMIEDLDKHSFNEKDLLKYSPISIEGKKKRVNQAWNMEKFLNEQEYKEFDSNDSK